MPNLPELFRKFDEEFCKFSLIEGPLHPRPDVCALLLLSKILPGQDGSLLRATKDGEILLRVNLAALAAVAREEEIRTLVRCGVFFDEDNGALQLVP